MSNAQALWLVCDSLPLPFNDDGLSLKSSEFIHVGSSSPTTQVISPLSSLESQHLGGLFHTFSFEQSPSSTTPLTSLSFVASLSLTSPSITTSFTTHFITLLVAP
jgi:hypothetical protein